jgi:predicted nucleic acid-binding protein
MPVRFIDSGHFLALADRQDAYHQKAVTLSRSLIGPFVTTEAVLVEVGNSLASERWRVGGASMLASIRTNPNIEIVNVTEALFDRAVRLYTARPDKEWGLTDCISFVVMQERGITEALAADQHYV